MNLEKLKSSVTTAETLIKLGFKKVHDGSNSINAVYKYKDFHIVLDPFGVFSLVDGWRMEDEGNLGTIGHVFEAVFRRSGPESLANILEKVAVDALVDLYQPLFKVSRLIKTSKLPNFDVTSKLVDFELELKLVIENDEGVSLFPKCNLQKRWSEPDFLSTAVVENAFEELWNIFLLAMLNLSLSGSAQD